MDGKNDRSSMEKPEIGGIFPDLNSSWEEMETQNSPLVFSIHENVL